MRDSVIAATLILKVTLVQVFVQVNVCKRHWGGAGIGQNETVKSNGHEIESHQVYSFVLKCYEGENTIKKRTESTNTANLAS